MFPPRAPLLRVGLSLRWKIFLPFVLLALALILGATLALQRLLFATGEDRFVLQLADSGQQAADAVVRVEERLLGVERLVANTDQILESTASADSEKLREISLPLVINAQSDVVALLDRQGVSLLTVRKPGLDSQDEYETLRSESYYAEWPFVRRVLAGESDPQFGAKHAGLQTIRLGEQEVPAFFVAGPIVSPGGEVVGAVVVGEYLGEMARELQAESGANASLYDSLTGELLASSLEPESVEPLRLPRESISAVLAGTETPVRAISIAGRAYREALLPFVARGGTERLGVLGTAALDVPLGQEAAIGGLVQVLPYLVFGGLLSLAAGWLISSGVASRLRRLHDALQSAADGQPFLLEDVTGSDEVTLLAQQWNRWVGMGSPSVPRLLDRIGPTLPSTPETTPWTPEEIAGRPSRLAATILSAHVRAPEDWAEGGDPADVAQVLADVLNVFRSILQRHRGEVLAVEETGIVGVFGTPAWAVRPPVTALLAMHAGVEILEHVASAKVLRATRRLPKLEVGVGLDTGPVVLGPVGATNHRKYVGIGATVSVARELDALARHLPEAGMTISGATYDAVGGGQAQFQFGRYGRVRLAALQREVLIYEVVGRVRPLIRAGAPSYREAG